MCVYIFSSKIAVEPSKPNITIREYPKNTGRKNPERFQFLGQNGTHHMGDNLDGELITVRLQDELSQTLSKANLKCDSSVVRNTSTSHKKSP